MLNGKFICVESHRNHMTKGNVYEFEDGFVVWDNGMKSSRSFDSVGHFNLKCYPQIAPYNPTPKDLLTVGRVVECRNGQLAFVLPDRLVFKDGWENLENFDSDLNNKNEDDYSIVKIYDCPIIEKKAWSFGAKSKEGLVQVWQRESKSPQQIEKEAIQLEMEKLAKRLSELEVK